VVNRDLIAAKLAELADRKERVRARTPERAEQLGRDRDALDIVSFNLMLCVQICADIASHIISDEGWVVAVSLAQAFKRLEEHGVLSAATAEALGRAVGFRNVVAHGYSRLDLEATFAAAISGLTDIDRFAREVSAWADPVASPAS
jgi:uncharacterized protein YutE (UPF0331/DUF86 family)